MISLSHLMVLQYIKRQIAYVRANPEYIVHALEGYQSNEDIRAVFGAKRVDDGILWFQQNEFNYTPLYNLDISKLPNINVSCESVSEGTQFIGDFAGFDDDVLHLPEKTYISNLTLKGITDERTRMDMISNPPVIQYGFPIVSQAYNIRNKVWRGLILTDGKSKYKITGFLPAKNGIDTVLVTDSLIPLTGWSGNWRIISNNNTSGYEILSSLDKTRIKVELLISASPETAEVVGCVLKYILKSGRMWFIHNKLENPVFTHSPMMRVEGQDNCTFSYQFTIDGLAHDRWYGAKIQQLDFINLDVNPTLNLSTTVSTDNGVIGSEVIPGANPYQIPTQTPKLLLGVTFADRNGDYVTDIKNFEGYTNTKHDLQQYMTTFDNRTSNPDAITSAFFNTPMSIWSNGKIPVITWYPDTSNVQPTPIGISIEIIMGHYDTYLDNCFTQLSRFITSAIPDQKIGLPKVFLKFAPDMNNKNNPWGNLPPPVNYTDMWRHIVNRSRNFPELTSNRIQFVWSPTVTTTTQWSPESMYPGDDFVDWIGLDGYNHRGFQPDLSIAQLFTPMLDRMKALSPSKPIMLAEFGVGPKVQLSYDLSGKEKWLREAYTFLSSSWIQKYNIKAAMYRNFTLSASDIDSGIFLHNTQVIDPNSLNTWYNSPDGNRYYTLDTIRNDYARYYQLGFLNAGVNIDLNVFHGSYPNT